MPPTVLLADPRIRIAGLRAPTLHRVERAQRRRRCRVALGLLATLLLLVGGRARLPAHVPPLATVLSAAWRRRSTPATSSSCSASARPPQVGDVVMIHVPDDARNRYGYPGVVIHRVKAIGADGMVTSQGDARKDPDPFTVPREALPPASSPTSPAPAVCSATSPARSACSGSPAVRSLLRRPPVARRRQSTRENRDQALEEALQAAVAAQALLAQHLAELPTQIERALATAVTPEPEPEPIVIPARPVPPTPPVPKPKSATPDLMGILAPKPPRPRLIAASAWDAPPAQRLRAANGPLCAVYSSSRTREPSAAVSSNALPSFVAASTMNRPITTARPRAHTSVSQLNGSVTLVPTHRPLLADRELDVAAERRAHPPVERRVERRSGLRPGRDGRHQPVRQLARKPHQRLQIVRARRDAEVRVRVAAPLDRQDLVRRAAAAQHQHLLVGDVTLPRIDDLDARAAVAAQRRQGPFAVEVRVIGRGQRSVAPDDPVALAAAVDAHLRGRDADPPAHHASGTRITARWVGPVGIRSREVAFGSSAASKLIEPRPESVPPPQLPTSPR